MNSLVNLRGQFAAVLSRDELKNVVGGRIDLEESGIGCPGCDNGNPCLSCTKLRHSNDDGSYGTGMCPPETGGTSCHNYCADGYSGGDGYYGWC